MVSHDAPVSSVPAPALRAFGERFRGRLVGPGDEGYDEARTIWNGAIDRRPGLVARCADRVGRRERGAVRARARPADVGAERRPRRGWPRTLRRRPGRRPVRVEGYPGRRGERPRGGRGRRHPRRARSRHAGVRARGPGRDRDAHGRRRSHPRRRDRVADPQTRPERRQPRGGGRRHGRRASWSPRARTTTRTCSGASGAAAATSAWSRRSASERTRSGRRCSRDRCSSRSSAVPRSCRRIAGGRRRRPRSSRRC